MKKLDTNGIAHQFLIVLVAVIFVAGFGAWRVFFTKAATFPTIYTSGPVIVTNGGDGARADITVKPGETKATYNSVNFIKRATTKGAAASICGEFKPTYSMSAIYKYTSDGSNVVQVYPTNTGTAIVSAASYGKQCAYADLYPSSPAVDLCKKLIRVQFTYNAQQMAGHVRACSLQNTKTTVNTYYGG